MQLAIAIQHSLVTFRSMLKNPLDVEDMDYDVDVTDFPDDAKSGWDEIALSDFDAHRQRWNTLELDMDTVTAFNNLSLGNYRWKRGQQYLTHLRQYEVLNSQVSTQIGIHCTPVPILTHDTTKKRMNMRTLWKFWRQ